MTDIEDIASLHDAACAAGQTAYTDPSTGYKVFTSQTLLKRGKCCGCGCRHCPYNHANVPMEKRAEKIKSPAMLCGSFDDLKRSANKVDLLLWSGGKDSFLAARALRREHAATGGQLLLLTTFDAGSRTVAHQEVRIDEVVRQAKTLQLPLVGVPLWSHIPYADRMAEAFRLIHQAGVSVARVCSGDLHLEEVARWRTERLGPSIAHELDGATIYAPLWNVPYAELLADLENSGTPCTVCALGDPQPGRGGPLEVHIGELFGPALIAKLPKDVDTFGENGEFHTLAQVWNATRADPLAS